MEEKLFPLISEAAVPSVYVNNESIHTSRRPPRPPRRPRTHPSSLASLLRRREDDEEHRREAEE